MKFPHDHNNHQLYLVWNILVIQLPTILSVCPTYTSSDRSCYRMLENYQCGMPGTERKEKKSTVPMPTTANLSAEGLACFSNNSSSTGEGGGSSRFKIHNLNAGAPLFFFEKDFLGGRYTS